MNRKKDAVLDDDSEVFIDDPEFRADKEADEIEKDLYGAL